MASNLIRLGHKCNQNCVFCTVALDNERELSSEEVRSKILFLSKRKAKLITFTGGEPTAREDLPDLIRFAKKCGINVELQTNGVLLSEWSRAEKIAKAGVDTALVSLHSHKEEISEKLTNSTNTFRRTLQGIRNLIKLHKNVQISHVINSMNHKDLSDFAIFIQKNFPQIPYIYFGFVRPNGNAIKNKWIVPKISSIDLDFYKAFDYCKKNGMAFGVEGIPLCYMQGFEEYSVEIGRILSKPVFYISSAVSYSDAHRYVQDTFKRKDESCCYCSLNDICPGVWREYAAIYGTDELFPIFISKDEIIKNLKAR